MNTRSLSATNTKSTGPTSLRQRREGMRDKIRSARPDASTGFYSVQNKTLTAASGCRRRTLWAELVGTLVVYHHSPTLHSYQSPYPSSHKITVVNYRRVWDRSRSWSQFKVGKRVVGGHAPTRFRLACSTTLTGKNARKVLYNVETITRVVRP